MDSRGMQITIQALKLERPLLRVTSQIYRIHFTNKCILVEAGTCLVLLDFKAYFGYQFIKERA